MIKKSKISIITLFVVLSVLLCAQTLSGCSQNGSDNAKISVICSVFPEYDWVRNVVGDVEGIDVRLLVTGGRELHGYEASPEEMVALKSSDLVISVGSVSDEWISDALKDAKNVRHLKLTEIPEMVIYEISSESDGHIHEEGHEHGHAHTNVDEHVWLSLKNAQIATLKIAEELALLDADNAQTYRENAQEYAEKLSALDGRMMAFANGENTVLFADRFPFIYLFEDYGIGYYAAFEGCSTDISWTPETTVNLAKKLDSLDKKYVFTTETSDGALARLVIDSSQGGGEIITLDSMQSVSTEEVSKKSYISVMEQNIAILERVFLP